MSQQQRRLVKIAKNVFEEKNSYTMEEAIVLLIEKTEKEPISEERAQVGFNLLCQEGILLPAIEGKRFHLAWSTPF